MGEVIQGPWGKLPPNKRTEEWPPAGWKPGMAGLSDVEARRAEILRARPKCKVCGVIYPMNVRIPEDRVCRACRRDLDANTTPNDRALF